ncbi:hypothetical protein NUSPORA_01092 [Nucleospora cyclopteri]
MNKIESFEKFKSLKEDYGFFEIEQLLGVCKKLKLAQQTVSVVIYNFYNARFQLRVEADEIVFYSALIDLSCKMCEFMKPIEKIINLTAITMHITLSSELINDTYIKAVAEMELDILFYNKFDLEPPLVYDLLQKVYSQKLIESNLLKISWLFLSDLITFLPCTLFFTEREAVLSALFMTVLMENSRDFYSESAFKTVRMDFVCKFEVKEEEMDQVDFLCDELLKIYENIK